MRETTARPRFPHASASRASAERRLTFDLSLAALIWWLGGSLSLCCCAVHSTALHGTRSAGLTLHPAHRSASIRFRFRLPPLTLLYPTSLKQLLLEIHLLSLSSSLPLLSRSFHSLFASAPTHHRATYLLLRHPHSILSHAVRYPICTLEVVLMLERIAGQEGKGKRLRCGELPRRLVRPLSATSSSSSSGSIDLPLIQHLLEHYHASPNSKQGYLLARAVFAFHLPLIRLLLRFGADPGLKEGWAVVAAISAGDEELVKLLLERGGEWEDEGSAEDEFGEEGQGKKRRRSLDAKGEGDGRGRKKKRRHETELRTPATSGMLEAAVKAGQWGLVDYLTEKGETISRSLASSRTLIADVRTAGAKPSMDVLKLL